jgi:hypothetical protein
MSFTWVSPVLATMQPLAPAKIRSMAAACYLFINSLLGVGLGVFVLGLLSDSLPPHFGEKALKISMMCSLGLYACTPLEGAYFCWAHAHCPETGSPSSVLRTIAAPNVLKTAATTVHFRARLGRQNG